MYPQFARAALPSTLSAPSDTPMRLGSFPYAFRNYFWSDHQQLLKRRQARDAQVVVGPIVAFGDCIYPLHGNGDLMWFDPTVPAEPGDIVIFQAPREILPDTDQQSYDDRCSQLNLMSKMLIEFAGEYWLAAREYMFPLGDFQILGVEVIPPTNSVSPISDDGAGQKMTPADNHRASL